MKPRAALEPTILPSATDVEAYEQHGWHITPVLFSEDDLDDALAAVEAHQRGERDAEPPVALKPIDDWQVGSAYQIRLNDYVALTNRRLSNLIRTQIIAETAARLSRADEIRLWQSGIVYKEPCVDGDVARIGWHTDRAYWRTCSSTSMLTAWIALQDCDEDMGCVTMLDGSHRWPKTEAVRAVRYGRTFYGTDPFRLDNALELTRQPIMRVPMTLRRGQVSFHHCMTVHGSGPNTTERPRIGVTVHLQDGDNRYQRAYDEAGVLQGHANDQACRTTNGGTPDYTDPRICPVLWSGESEEDSR